MWYALRVLESGCYAFMEEDPFVVRDCPHVFFAGNQDHYASSLLEGPEGQKVSNAQTHETRSIGDAPEGFKPAPPASGEQRSVL